MEATPLPKPAPTAAPTASAPPPPPPPPKFDPAAQRIAVLVLGAAVAGLYFVTRN